jgi:hypothetical protein
MISRQQLTQRGLGVGGVLVPDLQPAAGAIGAGLQLLSLRYGRDAEPARRGRQERAPAGQAAGGACS